MVAGVLAGFAENINADKSLIRLVYVLLSIFSAGFPGLLAYIIVWIVIPEKPY
jgi:phage shock protein C